MNSEDICSVIRRRVSLRRKFIGVFAKNEVPRLPLAPSRYPVCFVINTDKRGEPGEHWVAVYYLSPANGEFFDSFGNSPLLLGFGKRSLPNITIWSKVRLQAFNSDVCGEYCIHYLAMRSRGYSSASSIFSALNGFTCSDYKHNDDVVRRLACVSK
jgi:hypothetical protein